MHPAIDSAKTDGTSYEQLPFFSLTTANQSVSESAPKEEEGTRALSLLEGEEGGGLTEETPGHFILTGGPLAKVREDAPLSSLEVDQSCFSAPILSQRRASLGSNETSYSQTSHITSVGASTERFFRAAAAINRKKATSEHIEGFSILVQSTSVKLAFFPSYESHISLSSNGSNKYQKRNKDCVSSTPRGVSPQASAKTKPESSKGISQPVRPAFLRVPSSYH